MHVDRSPKNAAVQPLPVLDAFLPVCRQHADKGEWTDPDTRHHVVDGSRRCRHSDQLPRKSKSDRVLRRLFVENVHCNDLAGETGQRGQPDTSKTIDGSGPRVFDTYKALVEVFHNDGSAPADWNSFDAPSLCPCSEPLTFGDLQLASFSHFTQLGEAGNADLTGNVVSQNGEYIRYSTFFNQTAFNQIVSKKWFSRSNLPVAVPFPNGSVTVKAAWMIMDGVAQPGRYYTRSALVMDPTTGTCSRRTVGLVGLHIVQKTPTQPQWIWSSFEQWITCRLDQQAGRGRSI